ncbi:cubilin-like [Pecten maximus]|uniref:cubilin-like n=1 Tax=Pecten maximus TaxID=6579 RepID=UPI00145903F0|nr:cubilin-like [Pecten maximus]
MRNCYRLLLMLAMLAHTVRGVCECNSDSSELKAETNVYHKHGITCDEEPTAGLNCEWVISAESASTTIAVEFSNTSLDSSDPVNNKAEFKDASDAVITTVTSSKLIGLTPTTSTGTKVKVTLDVAANTNKIPVLEFGYIAVSTDNEDCQGKNGQTIELENDGTLYISSGNFPSNYEDSLDCTFTVTPKNGGTLSLSVVYMSTENVCPDADRVTLTFDNGDPLTGCGQAFNKLERNNIQSSVVVNFFTDGDVNEAGWLMHFAQIPENKCLNGKNNCSENADCTNTEGSFSCECKDGFCGDGVTCLDVNECQNGNNDCSENADCTNTEGSFSCACKDGFSGDGVTCLDENECQNGNNNCSEDADCTNTEGSFSCQCKEGFSGDGVACKDVCVPNPCRNHFSCKYCPDCDRCRSTQRQSQRQEKQRMR